MLITINVDIEMYYIFILAIISLTLFFYAFFDVSAFLTHVFLWLLCKIRGNKKQPIDIEDTSEYYSICLTTDVDIYYHMNNARYLRELNYARFYCLQRNGLLKYILNANGILVQTACHIRYRREIPLFTLYKITTKIIYWDEKHLYLEHYFITLKNGVITTVIWSKSTCVGVNIALAMCKLLGKDPSYRPEVPLDLEDWILVNKKSSNKLSALSIR